MPMTLTITLDDPQVLAKIAALLSGDKPVVEPVPAPVAVQAEKPAPKKRGPKPSSTRAAVLEDEPEPAAEEVAEADAEEDEDDAEAEDRVPVPAEAEDPDEDEDEEDGSPRDKKFAIQVVTEMLAAGKTREVKAALASLKAKRVSELPDSKVGPFLDALGV